MRLIEIFEEKLDEVSMSPGALADFAKTEFAQSMTAGFEAELVIPNAQSDDEGEMEPDYDEDRRCRSTQDIRDFFEGDYNGSRQVDRAIEQIDEEFFEYADEQIRNDFEEDERDDMIREILKDMDKSPEEIEEIMDDRSSKEYDQAESSAWEEYRDGADYDQYVRMFFDRNYRYMSDVANSVSLDWPYWTNGSGNGEGESSEDIAADIASSIGMPVKASGGYHSAKRGTGFFILEPDSSIDSDDGEAGLELVSPPMPLAQCLEYLDKVFAWADGRGCTTNSSTGFHMGISIPDQSRENVDHLKFTLFLGDEYVLKQFGRESNSYAKSMVQQIIQKVKNLNAGSGNMTAESILQTFKDGLNSSAAKFVKTSLTTTHDRYVTVNIKDKYIEVRSAGGDYLGDLDKIKNTLLRYVRAMALAADPEAEKQEYAKKLYKFISPMVRGDEDIIKYFTQFSAGTLPSTALKSFIRQAQMKRQNKKAAGSGIEMGEGPNLYLFKYYSVVDPSDDPEKFTIEVRGASRRDAIANFRKKFEEGDYNILEIKDIDITDDSVSQAQARASTLSSGLYRITNDEGGYIGTITSDNAMDAYTQAFQRLQAAGMEHSSWRLIAPGGRQIYPDPAFGPTVSNENRYIVTYTDANGGSTMTPRVMAATPQQAAEQILAQHPGSQVTSVQDFDSGGLGPNLLRSNQTSDDDIPELPGEFVADPMANAQTYIIKYTDPQGEQHQTAIDANSSLAARDWFISNHPRTYNVTDVYRHTA
jgi:Putative amidoligase enzyme